MAKTKDQMLNVRVNGAEANGTHRDEVFITSDMSEKSSDPYVNRVVYAKPGLFKDGQQGAEAVAALIEKSNKALADEHAATLEREAKERQSANETQSAKEEA